MALPDYLPINFLEMIELLIAILLGLVIPSGNTNEYTTQTSSENITEDTGGGDKQIPPQIF